MSRGRHGARRLLVQAFYQRQLTGHDSAELRRQFGERPEIVRSDAAYFHTLLGEVLGDTEALDRLIEGAADRPVAQIDPVERGVLWLGVAELVHHPDVPVGVVIDEAIELTREFGATDSHRYVNAVLDRVATQLRPPS
jgi:N utilization substance protein B